MLTTALSEAQADPVWPSNIHPLTPLLAHLEQLFAREGRPGGDAAAAALRDLGALPDLPELEAPFDLAPMAEVLARSPHADYVPLLSRLAWRCSGLSDGRIRPEIAHHMLTSEIVGPTGMIPHPDLRIGLFYQSAHVDYVMRSHSAEETFFVLAGTAHWSLHDGPAFARGPGEEIHHPSMVPHKSVTGGEPTLTAWRWTGDIRFETYELLG